MAVVLGAGAARAQPDEPAGTGAPDMPGAEVAPASPDGPGDDAPAIGDAPAQASTAPPPPTGLSLKDRPNDDGRGIILSWTAPSADGTKIDHYLVERAESANGPWERLATQPGAEAVEHTDVFDDADAKPWHYRIAAATADAPGDFSEPAGPLQAEQSWYNTDGTVVLVFVALFGVMMGWFLRQAKLYPEKMYIRRIPGIDAIEEAIGRATEMGRPVLYVPGIEEMSDIQTIASMQILGKVAEIVAQYNSEIIVSNRVPFVMTVAEEVVKQGFYNAGRPDAHKPENIRFISDEQFAFTAGTNGIMLREKPATNLFMGRFFAESLMLAETGFQAKAIQVAGTAEVTQLPFFIAACDYTLIGEELFAASAYLARDPMVLSTLKATDWFKVVMLVLLVVGSITEIPATSSDVSAEGFEVRIAVSSELLADGVSAGSIEAKRLETEQELAKAKEDRRPQADLRRLQTRLQTLSDYAAQDVTEQTIQERLDEWGGKLEAAHADADRWHWFKKLFDLGGGG